MTGGLIVGGTLDAVEFGDFDVSLGDNFSIVEAGTLTGSFRDISGLDVVGRVVLDALQRATGVTLIGRAVTHQGTAGALAAPARILCTWRAAISTSRHCAAIN